jgi:hypothetical protein
MNSQCTSEYINDSYTDAKICLFQMILGTPVVLTHTTHTHIPVRLSLHFADTGAVMRRVAYKTKQNKTKQNKTSFDGFLIVIYFSRLHAFHLS